MAADAILMIAAASSPALVFADDSELNQTPPDVQITDVIERLRNYFLGAVIVACTFMILWGAFNFVTAGGDEKKVESGRKTIYYAVIGLVIALLAMAITSLVMGIVKG